MAWPVDAHSQPRKETTEVAQPLCLPEQNSTSAD